MTEHPSLRLPAAASNRLHTLWRVVTVLCGLAWPTLLPAQAPLRDQTSLRFVPDDATFYSSSLHLKQRFEAFTGSQAFSRLRSLPFVKAAVQEFETAWAAGPMPENKPGQPDADSDGGDGDNDLAATLRDIKTFWNNPENRQLVAVALDAVSYEIFAYGDSSMIEFEKEARTLGAGVGTVDVGKLVGEAGFSLESPAMKVILDLCENLPVPAFVIGFKVSDQAAAAAQLARLETVLQESLQDYPDVKQGFGREKIGLGEFLTLKLDGSRIPWDDLVEAAMADTPDDAGDDADDEPLDEASRQERIEQGRAIVKAVAGKLNRRSLTLSLGLYDGYLLFSFGETNSHLSKLSEPGHRLIDRPELAPLLKMSDRPLTGIQYYSRDLSALAHSSTEGVDSLLTSLDQLGAWLEIKDAVRRKLADDVKALATEAASATKRTPGAVVNWQYLTAQGSESYSYDYGGGDRTLDGSKPLSILEHVGADPLIVAAARHKGGLEAYQFLAKSLSVLAPSLDSLVTDNLPPGYDVLYLRLKAEFAPLVEKLHTITSKQLYPALADGQSAFVLDGSSIAVPIPELTGDGGAGRLRFNFPALVYGVTDAPLLTQAGGGYFAVVKETAAALNRLLPDLVAPIDWPPPQARQSPDGTLYLYTLAGDEHSDDEIALTAAVGTDVAVLALVPSQAQRYLKKSRFLPAGVLERSDRPAARVWYLNVAGLIQMIEAWVNFGFETAGMAPQPENPGEEVETVRAIFEVLKCFRRTAGIQYFEGSVLVEHSETVFEDLK